MYWSCYWSTDPSQLKLKKICILTPHASRTLWYSSLYVFCIGIEEGPFPYLDIDSEKERTQYNYPFDTLLM